MGEAWDRALASGALEDVAPRCADPPPEGLLRGIELFNAGAYYECHEELEAIWHAERGPIRYLYQGILQVGVGFHHWRRGNFRGATLLLRDGIDKVSRYPAMCMKVDAARLTTDARRCSDELQSLGPERMGEFDWSHVPTIVVAAAAGEGRCCPATLMASERQETGPGSGSARPVPPGSCD
jgi:hypothetical protein